MRVRGGADRGGVVFRTRGGSHSSLPPPLVCVHDGGLVCGGARADETGSLCEAEVMRTAPARNCRHGRRARRRNAPALRGISTSWRCGTQATGASTRAARAQSRLEHVYRESMSALIAVDDLREVAAKPSSTAALPARATTCATSPSASGTRFSKRAESALQRKPNLTAFPAVDQRRCGCGKGRSCGHFGGRQRRAGVWQQDLS